MVYCFIHLIVIVYVQRLHNRLIQIHAVGFNLTTRLGI